jgi:hypothetical protein
MRAKRGKEEGRQGGGAFGNAFAADCAMSGFALRAKSSDAHGRADCQKSIGDAALHEGIDRMGGACVRPMLRRRIHRLAQCGYHLAKHISQVARRRFARAAAHDQQQG